MDKDGGRQELTLRLPPDEAAFVRGIAEGVPLDELATIVGWPMSKARQMARSSRLLMAVNLQCLATVHAIYVPAAVETISWLSRGVSRIAKKGTLSNSTKYVKEWEFIPVSPAVQLEAAKTILKIAHFEENVHRDPDSGEEDLSAASPDRLRDIIASAETMLAHQAKPVSAPNAPDDAPVADELPSNYSVLD